MSMPTEKELEHALNCAKKMRETNQDDDFIAKSLLSHNYRLRLLQHVMEAAGHFLHSGNSPKEHSDLLKAIEAAKEAEYRPGQDQDHSSDLVI